MKNIKRITIFCLGLMLSFSAFGQNNYMPSDRADGMTSLGTTNGVEVLCIKTKCSGKDVLIIRMINSNNFDVNVKWGDLLITGDSPSPEKSKTDKSILIPAQKEVAGNCTNTDLQLVIDLSSVKNFQSYKTSDLTVTQK